MSRVTDVILTFSIGDVAGMETVNRVLRDESEGQAFVLTSAHEPQDEVSGGGKRLQASVAMGAFNYVSDEVLIEAVRSHEWKMPERVQIFVKGEHDENGFHRLPWRPTEDPFSEVLAIVSQRYHDARQAQDAAEFEAWGRVLQGISEAHEGLKPRPSLRERRGEG